MLKRDHLKVDVADLIEARGERRALSFSEAVADLGTEMVRVDDPLNFELVFESLDEGVVVHGAIAGTYVSVCRRCLTETRHSLRVDAAEVYRRPGDEVWEENYVVDGTVVDLEPMVRDDVGLELPMFPVCREDCAGLCPTCGADLNQGPCGCPDDDEDPRWAALKKLLNEAE